MRNKLAQSIIVSLEGTEVSDQEKEVLKNEDFGGVILFSKNYQDPGQLAELVNSIQSWRKDYPLLICADHEGGRVQRFKSGFTHFPSAHEIAKSNSPKLVFEVFQVMARELSTCGVNLNFAPVCDLWTNPSNQVIGDRSFGDDPEEVSKLVSAAIRGLQSNGVIGCAKHFPGHGDTLKDSHFALPLIKNSMESMESRELIPFQRAVKARVEMLMMAHLQVDAIDEEQPISMSPKAYDYVREKLRFQKLIVTDDLEMKGALKNRTPAEAGRDSYLAGADLLCYRSVEHAVGALDLLSSDSSIEKARVDESFNRIVDLKKNYLEDYRPVYIPDIPKNMGLAGADSIKELLDGQSLS